MRVRIIEPIEKNKPDKLRVCAYVRVSTDSDKQENSLENQSTYFDRLIHSNPEYEFAGIFSDQGISGYYERRPGFQAMMKSAIAGEIDLILTKSVSRFARNTVTVLKYVRELKALDVGIYFEEQNINTLSNDGELMITVLAAFAEAETFNISENNKWSIRKRFERGEPMINTSRFMGYDKDKNDNLIINCEEAEVVEHIFNSYLDGNSMDRIAKELTAKEIPTVAGGRWYSSTIRGMLTNEKYKGDCILQKFYTPNDRKNYTVRNKGEIQSYYVKGNHPAIIPEEKWEQVQRLMEMKAQRKNIGPDLIAKYQKRYPLSGMLHCPYCGKGLRRRQVHNKRIQWICSTYLQYGKGECKGIRLDDSMASKWGIKESVVVKEVITNGKKHYSYTSCSEWDNRNGRGIDPKNTDGGILPSIDRPRRTVIKL